MNYILKTVRGGPLMNNCYLLVCAKTGKVTVIDPSVNPQQVISSLSRLKADLRNSPELTVAAIINTHGHYDHVIYNEQIREATDFPPVMMHGADAALIKENRGPSFTNAFARQIDVLLTGGEVIEIGELRLAIIHTPGHSPGGICIHCENLLFSGDTLFRLDIGRCDLVGGNLNQLVSSIKEKLLSLPDETIVLPGHEGSSTIWEERSQNPYLR